MINLELTGEARDHVLDYQNRKKKLKGRGQISQGDCILEMLLEHRDMEKLKTQLDECQKLLQDLQNARSG